MQLAIDTSTTTASLALIRDNQILAELSWYCRQNHTIKLLPYLAHLLKQADSNPQAVTSIIVARGPGSFNGLRVGVSAAKGLAFSLGIPIVGINTMEAEAYQHAATKLPICPIFNPGRGEIAIATYQMKQQRWQQIKDEQITTVDDLCSQITTKTIFCGEMVALVAPRLKERLRQKAVIVSPAAGLRRASFLAELGQKRLEAGNPDNPATLHPLYFRRPNITKSPKLVTIRR
ncbi:MAG: tRNA (adenosine(37)-N6)-threonylcarbamoyltransferase complex dimerization subunit type 1 TsaB [Dehalococcoidales bacterium]|nr:tRNA (adenosine(37)-N6)-threonylcarbamoyltransferase complex dimerization subunit type 1 TsaB [Dehalococcoidales bacterium]